MLVPLHIAMKEFCNYKWKVALICFGFINYVGQESMCKVLQRKRAFLSWDFRWCVFEHFLSIYTVYDFHLHRYYLVQLYALALILMQNKWYGWEGKLLYSAWLNSLSHIKVNPVMSVIHPFVRECEHSSGLYNNNPRDQSKVCI